MPLDPEPAPPIPVWPPPPVGTGSDVWPPPPSAQAQSITVPFRTLFLRVRGTVPNLRVGTCALTGEGVTLEGKAVLPYEWQMPILLAAWLINLLVHYTFLGAYIVLEYAARRAETLHLSWEQVSQVVLVPKARLACIVYDGASFRGRSKTYSLTFRLSEAQFHAFAHTAEQFLPGRVGAGKLRRWSSPRIWIVLGGLVVLTAYTAYRIAHGIHP